MRGCKLLAISLAISLLSFAPIAQADDDSNSANGLVNGVSSNGYVCSDDGCAPTDETDWWKIYGYKGDIIQIGFSGSMNNPAWWCPGDGWEADFSIHDSSASQISIQALDDSSSSTTLSTTLSTAGWVYAKVKGKDSCCLLYTSPSPRD